MSHLIVNGVDKTLDHIYVNTGNIVKEAWEARTRVILHGLTNPLCGMNTYKDTLDLSTGVLTRYVKKLVFTGSESFITTSITDGYRSAYIIPNASDYFNADVGTSAICSHLSYQSNWAVQPGFVPAANGYSIYFMSTYSDFAQFCADEYSAGHPVTVWYVLATPTTETITLPSNLTGIVEGYLTQTGTPTPTNPIYPTANDTLEQDGTYSLDTGAYAITWGRADTFTGTSSISARCYGLPVKSWEIDGNSQQSGVPAPDDPITPEFVGERTENLFYGFDYYGVVPSISTGTNADYPAGASTDYIKIDNPLVTLSKDESFVNARIYIFLYDDNKSFIGAAYSDTIKITSWNISDYTSAKYARIRVDGYAQYVEQYMLNLGSTAKPYELHGYKLPITSAGQTVPVYLGQVQTVRRIKKLVLDGTEDWIYEANYLRFKISLTNIYTTGICVDAFFITHFQIVTSGVGALDVPNNAAYLAKATANSATLNVRMNTYTDASSFKQWLADQYAAGTPVTVWYVLATPETGIVNEPLAKIGNYADTLTSAQAGVTLPTNDGSTTIYVDTSLAPSKFELKLHAKPITGT